MSTPLLADIDRLAMRHSFAAACGITALHLVLEDLHPEAARVVKEDIIKNWRDMWKEVFQEQMARYNDTLNKTTNSHKLNQPEDFQREFSRTLADIEKSARVTLRMNES